jgi:hypothetical protein
MIVAAAHLHAVAWPRPADVYSLRTDLAGAASSKHAQRGGAAPG